MVFMFSFYSVALIALFLLPFSRSAVSVMTSDQDVIDLAAQLLPPILLNTFLGLVVECNTGGVFTSQGRTKLSTFLSMGVELPLNIGSVAFLVLYMKAGLVPVYWIQAAVTALETVIVMTIFFRSDWDACARDAKLRQEVEEAEAKSGGVPSIHSLRSRMSSPGSPMKYQSPVHLKTALSCEFAAAMPGEGEGAAGGAQDITMNIEEI